MSLQRTILIALTCAALSACASQQAAVAPPSPTPQQILASASADDFTCTKPLAAEIEFTKFSKTPEAYVDKCIVTKGLASFRYLFKDGASIVSQKIVPPTTIGLYWKDEAAMKNLEAGPQFVEIVGRVRNCDARRTLEQAAGAGDTGPCEGVAMAIFVSQNHVFPTAMD